MARAKLELEADSRQVRRAKSDLSDLERQGKKTDRVTQGLTKNFKLMGAALGAAGIAAAGAAFAKSARDITVFSQAVADLSAITGATGRDLEFFAEQSKEIGRTTSLSASQAASAFKLIASAQPDLLKNADALAAVTKEAVTLAEAAGIQLPAAASALGSAINQFSLDADQANEVINILAASAQLGAAEIPAVTEALRNAGPAANALGVDLAETVAGIQALATSGRQGADAGTGLRQVLLRLEKTADADLQPSLVGLSSALETLRARNLSNTELMKLFGDEAFSAATALLEQSGVVADLNVNLRDTDTATEQASIKMDTLGGDAKELMSAVEGLAITFGEGLEPSLRSSTQWLTEFINKINEAVGGQSIASLEAEIKSFEETLENGRFFGRSAESQRSGLERQLADARRELALLKAEAGDIDGIVPVLASMRQELAELEENQAIGRSGQRDARRIAELRSEITQLETAQNAYHESIVNQNVAITEITDAEREWLSEKIKSQAATKGATEANEEATQAITKLTRADENWLKSQLDNIKAVEQLDKELNPLMNRYQEWIDNEQLLDEALEKGYIGTGQHTRMIEQLGEQFDQTGQNVDDFGDKNQRSADSFQTAWERGIERVDDMFAGMWESVFNGFDDFGDTLKRSFTGLLAELSHAALTRPITVALTGGGTMAASGAAGASQQAGGMGVPGGGMGIFQAITQGFGAVNDTILSAGAQIGVGIYDTLPGIGDLLIENSQLLGNIAPFASGAISLLSGDIEKGIGQGIGAAIGSMTPLGPLGGFIGSSLGGLVGGLFGGEDPKLYGNRVTGTQGGLSNVGFGRDADGGDALRQLSQTFLSRFEGVIDAFGVNAETSIDAIFRQRTNTRGFFRINGDRVVNEKYNDGGFEEFARDVLTDGIVAAIESSGLPDAVRALFDGLAGEEEINGMINAVAQLGNNQVELADRFGITSLEAAQLASESSNAQAALTALNTAVGSVDDVAAQFSRAIQNMSDVLGIGTQRLAAMSIEEYDAAMSDVNTTTEDGRRVFAEFLQLRPMFVEMREAVSSLRTRVADSISGIISPSRSAARSARELNDIISELGVDLPQSNRDLIELADSIDYTTESGLNLAAAMPQIVNLFGSFSDSITSAMDSARNVDGAISDYNEALDESRRQHEALMATYGDQIDTVRDKLSGLRSVTNMLGRTLDSMNQPSSIERSLSTRSSAQDTLRALLMSGVTPDPNDRRFTDALDAVKRPSEDLFSSFTEYQNDFWRTYRLVYDLERETGRQLTAAERQLNAVEQRRDDAQDQHQQEMSEYQRQYDAIMGVNDSVISVSDAIQNLADAMGATINDDGSVSGGGQQEDQGQSVIDSIMSRVDNAYRSTLGRPAEQAGIDYWTEQIQTGAVELENLNRRIAEVAITADPASAIEQIGEGAFNTSLQNAIEFLVSKAYRDVLGRQADQGGLDFWSGQLESGAISPGNLFDTLAQQALSMDAQAGIDALGQSVYEQSVAAARDYLSGVNGFASGGSHSGGLRIVGERGPELEATGPSKIISNSDIMQGMSGDSGLKREVAAMRSDMRQLLRQITKNTGKTAKQLLRWDLDGLPEERVFT